jgi:23S rRNA (adenine2503-C2)-methyltransferase|uniref:Putative Fe-S-cluster redox enzyme n=1 Tax=Podoviridae sp. ct8Lf7 TaxID=2827723 RepID=A0A8S5S0Q1_9CAUD|nr:MAG TPA: putative Fe-S-cluster redox enzyme [Podoviridae sp. ct8Lf7]
MEGNRRNVRTILTHTGKIYVDIDNQLEFLTVGDYGKENNIKADFLGLTKEIHGVENTAVDLSKKWVATISTQKGCPMHCKFCDVPKFGFYGNASIEDMERQIRTIIEGESIKETDRFNVHFARMGEPTWNENVLAFGLALKGIAKSAGLVAKTIHPVVSTMLPKANSKLGNFLQIWCSIKNEFYNGEAGLQLSINSTDDGQRSELFSSRSLSLTEISRLADKLPMPVGRKYTLNFPVTAQTILDARKLSELFDKDKFIVKITPIHETTSAIESGLQITGYTDYDVYRHFEQPLLEEGWDVIVFVPSKEEDSDRITCGNALIAFNNY